MATQSRSNDHPEADGIEKRKGDVACTDLQRHDDIHQADDQRHGDKKDHDHAVLAEKLVVMVRGQKSLILPGGDGLLGAHHDRVGETAQQHGERDDHVHHTDFFVIDGRQPF
jgi:hypothetical protein